MKTTHPKSNYMLITKRNNRFLLSFFSLLFSFSIVGCKKEEPLFQLESQINQYGAGELRIQSISDAGATIEDISINKGRCKMIATIPYKGSYPIKMEYGQKIKILLMPPCYVLSVDITTQQGNNSKISNFQFSN